MSKNFFRDLDKSIMDAKEPLARLFRKLVKKVKMTPEYWSFLVDKFVNDPVNGAAGDPRKMSSLKSNLQSELYNDTMSGKVFIKAVRFLRPKKARLVLEVIWDGDDKPTSVGIAIYSRKPEETENDDETSESNKKGVDNNDK